MPAMIPPPILPGRDSSYSASTRLTLLAMRCIWGAMLMGPLVFMGVVKLVLDTNGQPARETQGNLVWVNLMMMLTVIPAAYLARILIFKKWRLDGVLRPAAFALGGIIFWSACESVAFFGLVIALLSRTFRPTIPMVAIALALQVGTFPLRRQLERTADLMRI